LGIPVGQTVPSLRRGGFTLIEILVALGVIGVGITILFKTYTSSLSVSTSNQQNIVASSVAEEYMNELRIHPELFIWPNYSDTTSNEGFHTIGRKNGNKSPIVVVEPPTAVGTIPKDNQRDKDLYGEYTWAAYARLNADSDDYAEVMVEISWSDKNRDRKLCLTSLFPRKDAEGIGQ
jgi:prepilin-type N-terminal cleavage/methylation domain-containing protein